ncbi:MAG: hypothetical protein KatS3mg038_3905 [Candidatus Kapaibacterium sp.]|nr:MAG: hypothetical protein KatS3mg038_3905 [Candidatus Kapabacteria bacterium]
MESVMESVMEREGRRQRNVAIIRDYTIIRDYDIVCLCHLLVSVHARKHLRKRFADAKRLGALGEH